MLNQLKKYGSVLLLLLFLFPIVEKQIHTYDHLNDPHCNASDKHYHATEHNCSICEFTLIDSLAATDKFISNAEVSFPRYFHVLTVDVHCTITFSDLPSRAPPSC